MIMLIGAILPSESLPVATSQFLFYSIRILLISEAGEAKNNTRSTTSRGLPKRCNGIFAFIGHLWPGTPYLLDHFREYDCGCYCITFDVKGGERKKVWGVWEVWEVWGVIFGILS